MPGIYLGVGSNVERRRHIAQGLAHLGRRFGPLRVSPVYQSAAVGLPGPTFYNLVVGLQSEAPVSEVVQVLRAIEVACGRRPEHRGLASRTLDLDLLLYGDLVESTPTYRLPRADILKYGFVLKPLADIAPEGMHPTLRCSYAALWKEFRGAGADLKRVAFDPLARGGADEVL